MMEKHQLERREKIAATIFLAAAGAVALWAKKEGKTGIARSYPGGSFFVDIVKDAKSEATTRLAFIVESLNPPKFNFDHAEHTDEQLDELEETFDIKADAE